MSSVRINHQATLLPDGTVLVTGGIDEYLSPIMTAERYNPIPGTWSGAGAMKSPRAAHTATLLLDGRVLVVGGYNSSGPDNLATAEVYDPATKLWSDAAPLASGDRTRHTATLLLDGRVLVAGGSHDYNDYPRLMAELYDPATNTWSSAQMMSTRRDSHHTATRLSNGEVLVTGGWSATDDYSFTTAAVEIYNPASNSWRAAEPMLSPRAEHTATLLSDGKVLVTGGINHSISGQVLTDKVLTAAEIYDPVINTWVPAPAMASPHRRHTAVLLPNKQVLISGGYLGRAGRYNNDDTTAAAELYDPASNAWRGAGVMSVNRGDHSATLLADGTVLVSGGEAYPGPVYAREGQSTAELYTP